MSDYTYLLGLVKIEDEYISKKTIDSIKEIKEAHIYIKHSGNFKSILGEIKKVANNTKLYAYCSDQEQYAYCLEQEITPHIYLEGKHLLSDFFEFDNQFEFFWVPTLDCIQDSSQEVIDFLNQVKRPVCISIGEPFNKDLIHEKARNFIKEIHLNYDNPIKDIEYSLTETTVNDKNIIVTQKNSRIIKNKMILGIFGDFAITDEDYIRKNTIYLMKNRSCTPCNHLDSCLQRGLGYIIYKQKLKGCIGIKLLNPS